MTTEITHHTQTQTAPDLEWYKHSQQLLSAGQVDDVRATLIDVMRASDPVWLMARIAALLSPYFDKDTPQGVREIEAEDWAVALEDYPRWAVERACRWWKSEENPRRHRRPMEGDIAGRIKSEMVLVNSIKDSYRAAIDRKYEQRPEPVKFDPKVHEQRKKTANDILKKAGFTPKRMGAAE